MGRTASVVTTGRLQESTPGSVTGRGAEESPLNKSCLGLYSKFATGRFLEALVETESKGAETCQA